MKVNFNYVLCHYGEIGLKGKNRKFFEEKLVENIKRALERAFYKRVQRISGRVLIELGDGVQEEKIKEGLSNVFGIAYFAFAVSCEQEVGAIQRKAVEVLRVLRSEQFGSFRVKTQRSKKEFSLTSQEVNERVGEEIVKQFGKKVDLENPDITLFIEVVDPIRNLSGSNGAGNYTFLYLEKIVGLGGLPVSASGKAMSLLSGGIDSPVASFYGMKRGIKIIFVHFHALPYVSRASTEKAKEIIKVLNKYQGSSMLCLVPFADIQKEILLKTKAKLRVVLYRRFMLKIAEVLAKKEKAKALLTGESVGQVASQTLENILAIEEAVEMPVLRPLICHDKQDIINKAKEIGTFEISTLPHQDCCARFLPKHPATKADLREVKKEEKKLNIDKLIKEAIKKTEVERI